MDDQDKPEYAGMTLADQAFLKELGISGMPSGAEYALQQFEAVKASMDRINDRADQLQTLELREQDLELLARDKGCSVDELREELRLFKDIDKLDL